MTSYAVIVVNLLTNQSSAVTVSGEDTRDAALNAAGTSDSEWSAGVSP